MGWVYRLRKLETESPIASFHRDIDMFDSQASPRPKISRTAAAINYWLTHDQKDIPVNITRMSFASYSIPIDQEGTLPVALFGRKLNLKRLEAKKTPWLICIADGDDLVDKEASLAALNYIDAEVCVFPKGHASIATSWSIPTSGCPLHLRFCVPSLSAPEQDKIYRGPVCFQMIWIRSRQSKPPALSARQKKNKRKNSKYLNHMLQSPIARTLRVKRKKSRSRHGSRPLVLASPAAKAAKKTKTGPAAPKRRPSRKSASPKTKLP